MGKPSLINEKEAEIIQPKIEKSIINETLIIDLNNDTLNITTNKNLIVLYYYFIYIFNCEIHLNKEINRND